MNGKQYEPNTSALVGSRQRLLVHRLFIPAMTSAAKHVRACSGVVMQSESPYNLLQATRHTMCTSICTRLLSKFFDCPQLEADIQQLSCMLAGDKVESMLQEEAAAKDAFEQQVAALKQELQECNQRVSAANQQREEVARQLQESQQQLAAAEAQHRKAVRKLDKKLVHLAQEFDVARQELMIKSAEIMDLLSQIKENEVKHETELAAADEQVGHERTQAWQMWLDATVRHYSALLQHLFIVLQRRQ